MAGLLLGCSSPRLAQQEQKLQLPYRLKDGEKAVDFAGSRGWQPQWQDSLIARLERGALPALDQDNRPLPADSLPQARRLRGLVLMPDDNGQLRHGTLQHPARAVRAYLATVPGAPALDLYFYDQAISLENFYARIRQADLEKLTGRPLEFVAAP
jgi:hypothetical protein